MSDALAVTAWDVPADGYRWVRAFSFSGEFANRSADRFLVARPTEAWRRYWPLDDHPGLFRSFAELRPDEESILQFSGRHGWLGVAQDVEIPSGDEESVEVEFGKGERFELWKNEILGMQHAVRVWEALQVLAVDDLQSWFRVEDVFGALRATYVAREAVPRNVFSHEMTPEGPVAEFQWYLSHSEVRRISTDPGTVALSFLRTMVEARLREQVGARIVYTEVSEGGPLTVGLFPRSLLGALWLQCARAIESNKSFGRCRGCHGWFEVPVELLLGKTSRDVGYCSVDCRAKASAPPPEEARPPSEETDPGGSRGQEEDAPRARTGSR